MRRGLDLVVRRLDRIVQQQPITAAHHLDAVGDKAASLVLARIDFKILLAAVKTEQDFGDRAVAFAAKAGIQSTQGQDVPGPKLRRQLTEGASWPMALKRLHQTTGRVRAQVVEIVHRQNRAVERRRVRNGVRQPELMRDSIDLPDAVPAIVSLAQIEAVEMRKGDNGPDLFVAVFQRRQSYGLWL